MGRHTKIIATVGPAVASEQGISDLITAGTDVARLNFSHGDRDGHRQFAEWVRSAAEAQRRPVALLQDLAGPKIRVGTFRDGGIRLEAGSRVVVSSRSQSTAENEVPIDYPGLLEDVSVGDPLVLADGQVRLVVTESADEHLLAEVVEGGDLTDHCGVALPASSLSMPHLTEKDRSDLEFGAEVGFDYVAVSFVRSGEDLRDVESLVPKETHLIAKVESAAAYENLDDVLTASQGVMVARGDLGVELPLEEIPLVQQEVLARTNAAGLISITATEMLESMVHASRPTRAEVTDVATAVLSGSDAVMLSAETAIGDHPARAVEAMARICVAAEARLERPGRDAEGVLTGRPTFASAVARAAVDVADDLDLGTIVAFTETGNTARLVSKNRPAANIVAFSPIEATRRRMALYWGVEPQSFERLSHTDDMIEGAESHLLETGLCKEGDAVVMIAGIPPNQQASTNLLKLHEISAVGR
ncbi:MAG: pyruvate kinase [Acidimicrobiia bacterium]